MTDEKAKTVRQMFEGFDQGDFEHALELTQQDFVMDWSNSIGPHKGVYRGRKQLLEFWGEFMAAWSEVSWEPQEFIDVDETHLVVINRMHMRGRGSGAEVDATGAQLWTFRDGLGESVKLFQTKDEALAAVGG